MGFVCMASHLLADPCVTVSELVSDLSEWLTHCHSDDVVLELQLLKRTLAATKLPDVPDDVQVARRNQPEAMPAY